MLVSADRLARLGTHVQDGGLDDLESRWIEGSAFDLTRKLLERKAAILRRFLSGTLREDSALWRLDLSRFVRICLTCRFTLGSAFNVRGSINQLINQSFNAKLVF